jgi:uncharacterized repeat protein (TIGR03806 family)
MIRQFATSALLVALLAAVILPDSSSTRLASAADHPIPEPLKKAPPTKFECHWADTSITIDGVADEPAWKHAQEITAFHLPWLGEKARMARTATTAKLLWDREYLYFFAEMEDTDLFADVTEHDGALWDNDVFELFFRPDADKPGYYEFQVNAAGAIFDAFYPKYDVNKIAEWSKKDKFHIDAKVKLRGTLNKRDGKDQGWSVEGRIPWTDFVRTGGRPVVGEAWKMNLCRYDYNKEWKEPELSCVAPIAKKKIGPFFHQSDDYATITFVGPNASTARPYGIDRREPLTTSTVVGFPDPPPPYRVVRALPEYKPDYPIMVRVIPGSSEALIITQPHAYGPTTISRVTLAADTKEATKLFATPFGGTAYDIAFHPRFAENGYVYFGWNGGENGKKKYSKITRYTMTTKPPYTIDTKTEQTIIEWESDGHNGAAVCFGPDGLMFVTSGDGTSDSDTNVTGQRTDLLLAKVLRINVDKPDSGKLYSVPADNPFVKDKQFAPETWAYGLRNPWRISYDAKTNQLWVGMNGQDLWESAYLVKGGENYGWSVVEGSHPFYSERKAGPNPFTKPTVEHHHSESRSLTGGIVYWGEKFPDLHGAYIYGDYSTGRIWGIKHDGTKPVWHKELAITTLKITGFAPDAKGELLICHHGPTGDGGLFTFEANTEKAATTFPRTLSTSGLFDSVKDHTMKPGVIPYSVNAPFWSDGMHKERFLALPGGEKIGFNHNRGWDFPDKTVLVKSFALETLEGDPKTRKWVETRFLTKQSGEWYGYSYLWNDAGTDATLIDAKGLDREYTVKTANGERKQVWHFPSRAECMVCHSRAQNFVLGLCEVQMNKDHTYPNGRTDNQLRVLEHLGLLKTDWYSEVRESIKDETNKPQDGQRGPKGGDMLHQNPEKFKHLVDPYDTKQNLTARARSWLHANCSSCHVEAGGGNAQMELEFTTAKDKMRVFDTKPVHQTFDLKDAKLVAPGAPERSVLIHRVGQRGPNTGQMPPLSTNRVDELGLALLKEWVKANEK